MFEQILTLSTLHVPGPRAEFGDARVMEHEYGWFVFTNTEHDVPDWLDIIMKFADRSRCVGILFDADVEPDSDFAQFDSLWEEKRA